MRRNRLAGWAVPTLVVALASWSQGAVLAQYDFGADHDNISVAANPADANVTASNLTWPAQSTATPPVTIPVTVDDLSYISNVIVNPDGGNVLQFSNFGLAPSLPEAYTNGVYFTWTVTAIGGAKLNLEKLEFDAGKYGAYNVSCAVNTSVDGFAQAANLGVTAITAVPSGSPVTMAYNHVNIDLSAAKFQGLDSITFRVYANDDWTAGTVYDQIVLSGTAAAVPEPAGLALLGLGGLVVLRRRRGRVQ